MAQIPFTLRIDAAERDALKNLSKVEGRPINQLLNEAIKNYLRRQGPKERGLETTLEGLRKYRQRDPDYKRAIAAFVEAEATFDDPAEGTVIEEESKPAGRVQSKIRKLLDA